MTYIKLVQGFLYLTAVIDVVSRKIMGWCLNLFLDAQRCLEVSNMAVLVAQSLVIKVLSLQLLLCWGHAWHFMGFKLV
jgi:putative transposase